MDEAAKKKYLRERGEALFGPGYGWQARMARALGINDRRIRAFLDDSGKSAMPVPDWLIEALKLGVMARTEIFVVGPPPGSTAEDDRDEDAYAHLGAALDGLVKAGMTAGWAEPEILVALLSLVSDRMSEGAGIAATIETLKQAISVLRAQRDT